MKSEPYLFVKSRTLDLSLRGETLMQKLLIRTNATLVKSYEHSHLILGGGGGGGASIKLLAMWHILRRSAAN